VPDILGDIKRRLEALEALVHGRVSDFSNRKLFKPEVALREGDVALRTVDRWIAAKTFPKPDGYDQRGYPFWWLSTLEKNDRERAELPTVIPKRPSKGKPAKLDQQQLADTS
jgi:hypothetical protein